MARRPRRTDQPDPEQSTIPFAGPERALLQALVDAIPEAAWVKDTAGRYVLANAGQLRLLGGRTAEEVRDRTAADFFPAELAAWDRAGDVEVMESGVALVEHDVLLPDVTGQPRWFALSKVPLRGQGDRVAGVLGSVRDITARKRVEEALRASEERYRAVVEVQTELICRFLPDTTLTFVNPAYCRYFGREPEELLGQSFLPLLPEDARQWMRERLAHLAEHRLTETHEHQVIAPDGRLVQHEWANRPVVDETGQVVEFQAVGRDVTELRNAQEALRESHDTAWALLNATSDMATLVSADWTILGINEALATRLGGSVEELMGSRLLDHMPPEVAETRGAAGEEVMRYRRPATVEEEYRGRHFITRLYPLPDAGGRTNRLAIFIQEVTEQKLAEAALRESEERLRMAVEASGLVLWDWDAAAGTMHLSRDLLGTAGDAGEPVTEAFDAVLARVHPDDIATVLETLERHLSGQLPELELEHRLQTAAGEWRWIAARGRVVERDAEGEPLRALGTWLDVTARKQAEEAQRRFEARLQHMQRLESLGVLAGGVAHDFNNLLTGILGHASLALMQLGSDDPVRPQIEQVEMAALRAADLARQMLAYSGRGGLPMGAASLSALVEDMTRLVQASISRKANLVADLQPDLPSVAGDATQLRQVILNLLTNASEALGDQPGRLTVTTGTVAADRAYLKGTYLDDDLPPGTYVYLQVQDTGCGMEAETRARVFDPFFTTKFTGRGLGLAAVLGIVRRHRGAVKVESELGQGATFTVLLPPAPEQPVAVPEEAPVEVSHRQGSGTILVADDEEVLRQVASAILRQGGFQVLVAADGQEAVEAFRVHQDEIALVLLDLTMPQLSGEEALREILAIRPDARVLLSSGYTESEATQRFGPSGPAGFVQKPYRADDLLSRVLSCLGQ